MIAGLAWIKDFIRLGLDLVEARIPFRLETGVNGDPATVYVAVTNHTKDMPLFIRQVRIHFGHPDVTYSFILAPSETQQIKPRDRAEFVISYAAGNRISRRLIVDQSKYHPGLGDGFPSFDHPAQLFHAIANGPKRGSWIEIDFNEVQTAPVSTWKDEAAISESGAEMEVCKR